MVGARLRATRWRGGVGASRALRALCRALRGLAGPRGASLQHLTTPPARWRGWRARVASPCDEAFDRGGRTETAAGGSAATGYSRAISLWQPPSRPVLGGAPAGRIVGQPAERGCAAANALPT